MNDNFIHITDHASKRAIQRFMMTPDRLKKLASMAITEGYSINDAPSVELRKYLKGSRKEDRKVYVYSGYLFVFKEGYHKMHLITAFRIPKYYLSTID